MSPSRRATDRQFAGALQDRVRHARRLAALSQAALASRVGVGPSAVAQWELPGGTSPTVEHMTRIAQTCDVQFEWLATGRGEVRNGHEQVTAVRMELFAEDLLEERLLLAFRRVAARKRASLVAWLEAFL